jgi:hypothetical protein
MQVAALQQISVVLAAAALFSPLTISAQTTSQAPATYEKGQVPDESVVPQWKELLPQIVQESKSYFRRYRVDVSNNRSSGKLTDEELMNGRKRTVPPVAILDGADNCDVEDIGKYWLYACYFRPSGPTAEDVKRDFVRLVRLMETVTAENAKQTTEPFVGSKFESRHVRFTSVSVDARWTVNSETMAKTTPLKLRSRLSVTVASPPRDDSVQSLPSGVSTGIDSAVLSGRYNPLPPSRKVGSSGSGPASITVTNGTPYVLTLNYEGVGGTSASIQPHTKTIITLPAASYRVTGRVSAPNVLPFAGTETLGAGDLIESDFYIASH